MIKAKKILPATGLRSLLHIAFIIIVALLGLHTASAQTVFTEGNALADLPFNGDTGATNSQLTLDFSITRAGVLQKVLTWGESDGSQGGPSGVGQSFQTLVLRPQGGGNYLVAYETPYFTVANIGSNSFPVSGSPFSLQVGDVIAHYGRGIPFNNHNNGPSSVYIATDLPEPVVGQTITVPSATYPVYNDGGRTYAIQVQAQQTFVVTMNTDNNVGSLRQAVLNNAAAGGGGIIIFDSSLSGETILLTSGQITLSNNVSIDASGLAGGIAIDGNGTSRVFEVTSVTVTMNALTITNGFASGDSYPEDSGGGILNSGTLTLNACALKNNQVGSGFGGGIQNAGGTLTVSNCTFANNNGGNQGGGIDNAGGTLTAIDCTFMGNVAVFGGGIENISSTASVTQCTIVFNQGGIGGGFDNYASTLNVTNCIVAGNTAGSGPDLNFESGVLTASHCLVGDGTASTVANGVNGNIVGTSAAPLNARLATLGNYGGLTQTMPPLAGSPAINAGGPTTLTTDQRGFPRLSGAAVDIGAVEVDTNSIVTVNTDNGAAGSLRYAVSKVLAGDLISFATNLSGSTILLTGGQITLSNNVSIDASGLAGGIAIDGHGTSRVFQVTSVTVTMNALTITNGFGSGDSYPENSGGGILNSGTLTLNACSLQHNQVVSGAGGGGIENVGRLTISNCTFANNNGSNQGGGIDNFSGGTVTAINCTFLGNVAALGGGIENNYAIASITQCTIVFNQGDTGGGLNNNESTLSVTNCILAGNTAGSGPDLNFESGVLTASHCLVGDGTASTVANGVSGNIVGTSAAPINALVATLGNYGGPTQTMPPLAGSPAIDAGTDSVTNFLTTDQRGHPRLTGAHVDIGAVEVDPNSIVTVNTDNGAAGSLRYVITNAQPNDVISFAPNLSGETIALTGGVITLRNNVNIDASGLADGIQLSGNNQSRAFNINTGALVMLHSLTLINCNGGGSDGGAIYNTGTTTINACTFTANATGSGGAILNDTSGNLTLNQCTITGNSAANAGGGGGIENKSILSLNQCTLTGNSAGIGGGLYNNLSGQTTVNNSIVAGNTATGSGGDIGNKAILIRMGTNIVQSVTDEGGSSDSGTALINAAPQLAALGNYGGPTQTMPPLAGSPAIDAGGPTSFTTDQRGYARVSGAAVDIGAVEVQFATAPYPVGGLTKLANGSIQFGLTNVVGGSFTVFASTNAALPFNAWMKLGTAVETPAGSGQFEFNDLQSTNYPQRFYRLRNP